MTTTAITFTADELATIHTNAQNAARDAGQPAGGIAHGACGFVWVLVKTRKNSKLAKALMALGWTWSDYQKGCRHGFTADLVVNSQMWQSMNYGEAVMGKFAKVYRDAGIDAQLHSRID